MAEHGIIDLSKKRDLREYVFLETKANWKEFSDFLNQLSLRPYCYQHRENECTCWYVGFEDAPKPYILHFNIYKKGLTVWFRRPQFLSKIGQEKTKPDNNYRYMPIPELDKTMKQIVVDYVKAIDKPLHDGKVAFDRPDKHEKLDK
jgi:hypothetical protein